MKFKSIFIKDKLKFGSPFLVFALFFLSGCNPLYVSKAAYYQTRLLLEREDNQDILNNQSISPDVHHKITLVKKILPYAKSLGLNTEDRYQTTSMFEFPNLWVLTAAPEFSLSPYTWWFPVVGEVPYKGYFELDDAISESKNLTEKNYDSSVREASAFSTLGWFQDPLTISLFKLDDYHFINTIFHELLHSTIWVKGSVTFNESLANIFGAWTALEFLQDIDPSLSAKARDNLRRDCKVSESFIKSKLELEEIYSSNLNDEEKRLKKKSYFDSLATVLGKSDSSKFSLNNASFLGILTYYDNFKILAGFFKNAGDSKTALLQIKSVFESSENFENPLDSIISKYPVSDKFSCDML